MDDFFTYRPRRVFTDPTVRVHRYTIKPYRLTLDEQADIDAVRALDIEPMLRAILIDEDDANFHGPGFSILHRGRDGTYLLAATWYAGHNLASTTMRVCFQEGLGFRLEPLQKRLFACVWELAVYEFERNAWIRATMMGRGLAGIPDYLESRTGGLV